MPQFGRARCAGRGGHRSSETTEIYQCKRAVVRSCGPSGARTMSDASVLRFSHDAISETRSMRSRRGTAGSHAGSASHGLGPRRPPTPLRRLRVVARPRRPAAPGRLTGVRYRRALRVDMKNDGEAVAPRDRSTGGRDGPRRMVRMARYQTPRRARGPDPPARQGPTTQQRVTRTASANTDLPRHGQPSGGPAHPRDPRATRMHAVLPRPLLSTRVLVLLPPNLPNLA